ncbi:MAG: hypothetical protein GXY34_00270 [Syntrophomonadaceae bacterium]|nr:hypothetical protein [Syntrophomonadaceae bacterium]
MREESIAIARDQYKISHISVQPVKAADKPRREKPSFLDIYRAQTGKFERKVHAGMLLLLATNVVNQAGKINGWW